MSRVRQTTAKRPLYVNGVYCESMAAAARLAGVSAWEMQRVVDGKKKIDGLSVSERPQRKTRKKETGKKPEPVMLAGEKRPPLLRWRHGESPLERGIGEQWR